MAKWQGYLQDTNDLMQTVSVTGSYLGGHAIGIIAVDWLAPKMPGNVANATTYSYPVLYKVIKLDNGIEQMFAGDPALEQRIVEAAKELERDGVRAIIGACGYFAHYQKIVAAAVNVPVFLSSLCQLPIIKIGLKPDQKILVMCADSDSFSQKFLDRVNGNMDDCVIQGVSVLDSFGGIRWNRLEMDNGKLTEDLAELARQTVEAHPEVGAILLECSDLPPYACAIQQATGLPVFDFITMIDWVEHAVVQKRYCGFF